MKHRWHETINDTVFYHETPFNVAVIVDQLSRHSNMLREIISEEKWLMWDWAQQQRITH